MIVGFVVWIVEVLEFEIELHPFVRVRVQVGIEVTCDCLTHCIVVVQVLVVVAVLDLREMLVMETLDLVTQVNPEILVIMGLMAIQVLL